MKIKINKTNILYFFISIILAVFLWVYIMIVQDPPIDRTFNSVNVNFIGREVLLDEKGYSVIEGIDAAVVSVKINGSYSEIMKIRKENIKVEADLQSIIATGETQLICKATVPGYRVTIVDPNTMTVTLNVDKIITKDIPVKLNTEVKADTGYVLGTAEKSDETVPVTGPMTEVSRIANALVTLSLDHLVNDRVDMDLPYVFADASGNDLKLKNTSSIIDKISVSLPVLMIREVPLRVNVITEGSGLLRTNVSETMSPSAITIAGERAALDSIDGITIGTITVPKDLSGFQLEYVFAVNIPEGIVNRSDVDTADVKIAIVNTTVKSFIVTDIQLIKSPENRIITAVDKQIEVELRGDRDVLNSISAADIKLTVDLSGISSSTGRKKVKASLSVDTDKGGGYISDKEYSVVVNAARR